MSDAGTVPLPCIGRVTMLDPRAVDLYNVKHNERLT